MQIRDAWPLGTLSINETVATQLETCLLEPFATENEAKQFWSDTATQLIHIEEDDTAATLALLGKPLQQRLANSLTYPEHSFLLAYPYRLTLSILSDDGAGVYLLEHRGNGLVAGLREVIKSA
ncbi:MAG: hypothetical protein KBT88_16140 [Gammaproteobacteria bacterium]|nr:hypothetical protein [Gammaproteobacteria bacterium]MBQ0841313.1 hypothetical protein [Gammaproteobacteria bacterium]